MSSRHPLYMIDKSALPRMPLEPVRQRLAPIIEEGEAATCALCYRRSETAGFWR